MHTTLYDPDGTYPEFADADVRTSPLNRVGAAAARPPAGPAPAGPGRVADAHRRRRRRRLQQRLGARLRHLGSHGRLLPQPGPLALPDRRVPRRRRVALTPRARRCSRCGPSSSGGTAAPAGQVDVYLANSRVVQQRIATTYGREAELLPPPHGMDASAPREPVPELDGLGARLRARRLPAAALQERRRRDRGRARHRPPPGRRRPRPGGGPPARHPARQRAAARRAERRAAARRCTPMRACSSPRATRTSAWRRSRPRPSACPTVALRGGGFLETVVEGETGLFFDRPTPDGRSPPLSTFRTATPGTVTHCGHGPRSSARPASSRGSVPSCSAQDEVGLTCGPRASSSCPWLVGAVDLVMIAVGDRAGDPVPRLAVDLRHRRRRAGEHRPGQRLLRRHLAGHAGLLRRLRPRRLRRRHRGVQARRQRVLLHRRARRHDGVPHAVPAVPRVLRAALPDRRRCCCCSAGCCPGASSSACAWPGTSTRRCCSSAPRATSARSTPCWPASRGSATR